MNQSTHKNFQKGTHPKRQKGKAKREKEKERERGCVCKLRFFE